MKQQLNPVISQGARKIICVDSAVGDDIPAIWEKLLGETLTVKLNDTDTVGLTNFHHIQTCTENLLYAEVTGTSPVILMELESQDIHAGFRFVADVISGGTTMHGYWQPHLSKITKENADVNFRHAPAIAVFKSLL